MCVELNDELEFCYALPEQRAVIKKGFWDKYKLPGCLGALDGCHIPIWRRYHGEHDPYYNRKGFMSLNLIAVVDSNNRFLYADCREPGCMNDARVWRRSQLHAWLQMHGRRFLNVGREFLIADSAFALQWHTMKAPDARTQNYRDHIKTNPTVKKGLSSRINRE